MNSLEIRYLGDHGSYSYEVAMRYLKKNKLSNYDLNSYPNISSLIKATSTYENSILVVPLENSTSGDVYETFNNLFEQGFNIINIELLEINHVLITRKDTDFNDVKHIYSHPQALIQVSDYLNDHNLLAIPDFSTTSAIKKVAKSNEAIGAIGSASTINLYDNLKIVSNLVNNSTNNQTKFIICRYQPYKQQYQINLNHTSNHNTALFLLFELNSDESGDLSLVLNILSKHNINLYNIKSKPIEGKTFEYYFIIEAYLINNLDNSFHYQVCEELKKSSKNYIYNTYNL